MKKIVKSCVLLFFCFYSLLFVTSSILSPILAKLQFYDWSSQCHFFLMHSCHQQPDRCFWVLGYPVSLCARCLGFYSAVFLSTIFILLTNLFLSKKTILLILFVTILDIVLNVFANINTGNIIRFFVGGLMGLVFVYVLNFVISLFQRRKNV